MQGLPGWVDALATVFLVLAVLTALGVAYDIYGRGHRQRVRSMESVCVLSALWLGPLALPLYARTGRPRTAGWQAQQPAATKLSLPEEAASVLATTQEGLARSADGGRSFTFVDTAPVLVVLAWPSAGALYGIDPVGVVHHSRNGGRTWVERGGIGGRPEAITVQPDGGRDVVYAAATDRGIVVSDDGGATFSVL